MKLFGKSVTDVMTRVFGVLLATLAAQLLIEGSEARCFNYGVAAAFSIESLSDL